MNAPRDPARTPRVARLLLQRLLPAQVREDIVGDFEEVFRRRVKRAGRRRARWSYWRDALGLCARYGLESMAERLRGDGHGVGGSDGRRPRLAVSWLDVKLAGRMLVRYPGITFAGGLGMAMAIGLGAGFFDFTTDLFDPTLPLEQGDRVVGVEMWDVESGQVERRILHDFRAWQATVSSLEDLGAFRSVQRNLIVGDGVGEAIKIAEISAAGLGVARTAPLLGRPLQPDDERPGAAPVAVIGHDLWSTRFARDPGIVGSSVRFGRARYTVVGVMPEDFRFPINHSAWIPLPVAPRSEPRRGPSVFVLGRLAAGASLAQAQAEIERMASIATSESPATHEHLRARVIPYTRQFNDVDSRAMRVLQLLFTALVLVPCANVAILVYARTMTRRAEITVRTALGASRARIVSQVFVEVLLLGAAAAAVGLTAARWGLQPVNAMMGQGAEAPPFWWRPGLAPSTFLYAGGLTVVAAAVAGAVPALRLTGRRLQQVLRQLGAGGSDLRLGRLWTGIITAQVALSVVFLPPVLDEAVEGLRYAVAEPGFDAASYLSARLVLDEPLDADADPAQILAFRTRFGAVVTELGRRLEAEPGVVGVTFATSLPGEDQASVAVELEASPGNGEAGLILASARSAEVAIDFFEVIGAPIRAGRGFRAGEAESGNVVVVNRTFVETLLGGGSAIGRRIRYPSSGDDPGPWYQIIGVVADLASNPINPGQVEARVFHPTRADAHRQLAIAIHTGPGAADFASTLRTIAASVDPSLRLVNVLPLNDVAQLARQGLGVFYTVLALAALSVLLLTTIGAYALMSFTVAQRRREIGIRAALGANPRRLLTSIFSRALRQLAAGALIGLLVATVVNAVTDGALFSREHGTALLLAVAGVMIGIGLLAAVIPARRGLAIQPTEALRAS